MGSEETPQGVRQLAPEAWGPAQRSRSSPPLAKRSLSPDLLDKTSRKRGAVVKTLSEVPELISEAQLATRRSPSIAASVGGMARVASVDSMQRFGMRSIASMESIASLHRTSPLMRASPRPLETPPSAPGAFEMIKVLARCPPPAERPRAVRGRGASLGGVHFDL